MRQPLHEFLQDDYVYLRARAGGDFFRALSPYVNALESEPEIHGILRTLEAEALEALEGSWPCQRPSTHFCLPGAAHLP
jgi:hypothetical protein